MGASGSTTIDFGAFPGASDAQVDVATAGVVAASLVEGWLMPKATADHSVDEHVVESIKVLGHYLSDGNVRIRAVNTSELNEPLEPKRGEGIAEYRAGTGGRGTRLYGLWTVGWVWS